MAPRDQSCGDGGEVDPEGGIEAPLLSSGSSFFQDPAHEDGDGDEEARRRRRRFLLAGRSQSNTTSQVALVGVGVCPIESLDYELIENEVFKQDWRARGRGHILRYVALKWALCFLVGVLSAAAGFVANLGVENVAGAKFVVTSNLMLAGRYGTAFAVFLVSNFALTMLATVLTVYVAPAAAGSGIPEVKAYLNGVDAPDIFSLKTLVVKIVGCIAAVSSSLHVGKAGPLVHTGACIASILGQGGSSKYHLTCKWLRYFKNDRDRRDLVTCGAGAGIAAAFRAPVGGVLFALEAVSSWWRSALLWRAFFTTAMVAVVLRALIDFCKSDKCGLFGKGGLIMFDVTSDYITYHLVDLPPVITLGVLGGVLGSLHNFFLDKVLRLYNFINEKGQKYKLLLAAVVTICTSCCLFGLPWIASCKPCPSDTEEACPSIGRSGATYGRLVGMLIGSQSTLDHGLFAVLGSAALLGGSMRMTVSVCVVILELTNNLLMLPLVMLVLLISKTVADAFNANIYDLLVKLKGFPYLEGHVEPYMRQLSVSDVVTGPLQAFNGIEKVGHIVHVLRTTGHNGFPVVDEPPFSDSPVLFGLVLRAHLLVLLRKKDFIPNCSASALDASKQFLPHDFAKPGSGKHDRIEEIEFSAEELEMFVDLHPFTNTSPYTVVETMSLAKAHVLFREVGLRHLLVLPKSSKRAPVVGILTRHDFMPEHILGLHPFLFKTRWKKVRFGKSAFTNLVF
uniref:Chloride channel protein n=1 Tax=Oryza rufipogon TaxID=4529 RepID=A0A0E0PET8_ORYRU